MMDGLPVDMTEEDVGILLPPEISLHVEAQSCAPQSTVLVTRG